MGWRVICGLGLPTSCALPEPLGLPKCGRSELYISNGLNGVPNCMSTLCRAQICGWSAWVCGPIQAPGGCDALHGNPANYKYRNKHNCPVTDPIRVPYYGYGNRLDYTLSCAGPLDDGDENLGFQTVRPVQFRGACAGWLGECEAVEDVGIGKPPCLSADEDIPAVAGLRDHYDWEGNYFCEDICSDSSPAIRHTWSRCELEYPNICRADWQWARIDLNLGGEGYASAPDMPVLLYYDPSPTPDPASFPFGGDPDSTCPCETADLTSAVSCEEPE